MLKTRKISILHALYITLFAGSGICVITATLAYQISVEAVYLLTGMGLGSAFASGVILMIYEDTRDKASNDALPKDA